MKVEFFREGMCVRYCPFCKLRILCDDIQFTMIHEDPICEGFNALMDKLNMKPSEIEKTIFVELKKNV